MYGIKSIHALTFYVSIDQEAVLVKGKEKQMSVKKREKKVQGNHSQKNSSHIPMNAK